MRSNVVTSRSLPQNRRLAAQPVGLLSKIGLDRQRKGIAMTDLQTIFQTLDSLQPDELEQVRQYVEQRRLRAPQEQAAARRMRVDLSAGLQCDC